MSDITDGIYPDMPEAEYRALPFPSQSTLKVLARGGGTPAHYKALCDAPEKRTAATNLGVWAHTALLEPHALDLHRPLPAEIKQRRGADWDALQKANPGVAYYPSSEWAQLSATLEQVRAMRDIVLAHPVAGQVMGNGAQTEVAVVWTDPDTGVRCKARLDVVGKDGKYIADYKTFSNVDYRTGCPMTPIQIADLPWKWGYYVQAAFYADGVRTVLNRLAPPRFYLILQESALPYSVLWADAYGAYDLRPTSTAPDQVDPVAFYRAGRSAYKSALRSYAACNAAGAWPGYGLESIDLTIPRWAEDDASEGGKHDGEE